MTVRTKVIGRQPTDHGAYVPGQSYGNKYQVELYGCVWESKHDQNNTAPATLNTSTGVITPNTTDWKKVSGSYDQWLIDNGYKKVSTSNVKDSALNDTQDHINFTIVGEIGSDSSENTIKGRIKSLEINVGSGGSVDQRIAAEGALHYLKSETYNKTEVNGLVSTPHQEYVTVSTYASLPASGSEDTIYRVSNYDGTQVAAGIYSEYAWDGTQYVFLCAKSSVGEVFDISEYNSGATYADLSAALGVDGANVPAAVRKGGMSIKYVQSSDNKYVQYRLMANTFSTSDTDWQGVDDEPTAGSDNLVKSGGVADVFLKSGILGKKLGELSITASGSAYLPFEFESGKKYIFEYVSSQNTEIGVLYTSEDESTSNKVNTFPNVQLVANEKKYVNFTSSGNAHYYHYYAWQSENITLTIFEDRYINVEEYEDDAIKKVKAIDAKRGLELYDFPYGGYILANGSIYPMPDTSIYGYAKVRCKEGDIIKAHVLTYSTVCAIAFYNNNGDFISGIVNPEVNLYNEAMAPTGTSFAYITSNLTTKPDGAPDFTPYYSINDNKNNIERLYQPMSQKLFSFKQSAPKKPCIAITMDVLNNFSFDSKTVYDYVNLLRSYGIDNTTFYLHTVLSMIGDLDSFVKLGEDGYDLGVHSDADDKLGDGDGTPHPTVSAADNIIKGYLGFFKYYNLGYPVGWVTSRGDLYPDYYNLIEKYFVYAHTTNNISAKAIVDITDFEEIDNYINKRSDNKLQIVRVGIENRKEEDSSVEQTVINNVKALIDRTIETNGFLCLYNHGYDALTKDYTARQSVLTPILAYIKQKMDNYELLAGSLHDVVPYFYE